MSSFQVASRQLEKRRYVSPTPPAKEQQSQGGVMEVLRQERYVLALTPSTAGKPCQGVPYVRAHKD